MYTATPHETSGDPPGGRIKRVLITGANKGIGLATARAVLREHADVQVLLGSRDPDRGRSAAAALCEQDPVWRDRLDVLQIDVCDAASVAAAADAVGESGRPSLFGLVNNAGIGLGSSDMAAVIDVNALGVKRVCDAFLPLLGEGGRVVNVSSAAGPRFVSQCTPARQAFFQDPNVSWSDIKSLLAQAVANADDAQGFAALGLGEINAYGLSKACTSLYTLLLAREHPHLCINACTPGYIETDLTRPVAERRRVAPAELGMKPPDEGTRATLFLLFGKPHGSGHYYGSDALRSPLDRYRAPGSPEYLGD